MADSKWSWRKEEYLKSETKKRKTIKVESKNLFKNPPEVTDIPFKNILSGQRDIKLEQFILHSTETN